MNFAFNFRYAYLECRFWAEVGPLQVFVSSHLIPEYLRFDANANPPAYVGEQEYDQNGARIEKGETVRIRIVGTRIDATEIVLWN